MPADTDATLERIWVVRTGEAPRPAVGRHRARRAVRVSRRRLDLGAESRPVGPAVAARLEPRQRRPLPALDLHVAGRPAAPLARHQRGRHLAHRSMAAQTWRTRHEGLVPRVRARGGHARPPERHCASTTCGDRATMPERLFMQFHGGVYRSDDAGSTWIDIAAGLPSDFGFPIVGDPAGPRQRLRHPDERRRRPGDGRRQGRASTRRATRAPRGPLAATGCRTRTRT